MSAGYLRYPHIHGDLLTFAAHPAAAPAVAVDPDGLAGRVVAIPVEEARYRCLRPVKGALAWLRTPVTGVLGEIGVGADDDWPRPALQRFDLRKREVKELVAALDWFRVSATAPGGARSRRRYPAVGHRPVLLVSRSRMVSRDPMAYQDPMVNATRW